MPSLRVPLSSTFALPFPQRERMKSFTVKPPTGDRGHETADAHLKVRITAKAGDEAAAHELLAAEEAEIRALLGDMVFGIDDESMEHAVGLLLDAHGLTLGLAESITGGLMGARLTDVAGASGFFRGSIVSYASEVKFDLLDVPKAALTPHQRFLGGFPDAPLRRLPVVLRQPVKSVDRRATRYFVLEQTQLEMADPRVEIDERWRDIQLRGFFQHPTYYEPVLDTIIGEMISKLGGRLDIGGGDGVVGVKCVFQLPRAAGYVGFDLSASRDDRSIGRADKLDRDIRSRPALSRIHDNRD